MTSSGESPIRVKEVVVLTTAMLTFISFWKAAAIVLCDMASTAYYVGGIAERAVGGAAPWFVLMVLVSAGCLGAVYVESCSMFVRGGVYKVVRASMGTPLAKICASALLSSFVLTGPISSVCAGHYLAGLLNSLFPALRVGWQIEPHFFSVLFAICVTLYFWRQNTLGIQESGEKSMVIMGFVTVMGVIMLLWCALTVFQRGVRLPPMEVHLSPHSLGWLKDFGWARTIGAVGMMVAFGHCILGMSGLETMTQIYREIEAPKLSNLKKTAIIVVVFCILLTGLTTLFSSMIIPDDIRMEKYADNLLGGLSMHLVGPHWIRLVFHGVVVGVGVMILSGAVNTAIVGSYGLLSRLAEDGILLDWFRSLHPKYGTAHRIVHLIVALQIVTILLSRGNVYHLGEAYAFGVVWSFVFETLSVIVLRFRKPEIERWTMPLNISWRGVNVPIGASLVFVFLLLVGVTNLATKTLATIFGVTFSLVFFSLFTFSERVNEKKRRATEQVHDELNLRHETGIEEAFSAVQKPNRVLVAVRDPHNLYHLKKVLETVDDDTTDVVVINSKLARGFQLEGTPAGVGPTEETLFTNVINVAEKYGKTVVPILLVSNDPAYAVAQAAHALAPQEVVMGISRRLGSETQVEKFAMAWGAIQTQDPAQPLTVRILWPDKELTYSVT